MRKLQMSGIAVALGAAVVVTAFVAAAGAGPGNGSVRATLNGYQEVVGPGSISTAGSGEYEAKVDSDDQTITYTLTYTLENAATQAHIHFAQRHVGGGVSAFLCGGGDKPPCPSPGGSVSGVIDPTDVIGPAGQGIEPGSFAELVRATFAGATYVNVHSSRWAAGEIRGQVADNDPDDQK